MASAFLYGQTRSGKSHQLLTMRGAGRVLAADADGQLKAEAPADVYELVLPPPLPDGASEDEQAERTRIRDERYRESLDFKVTAHRCFSLADVHSMINALDAGRLGTFATLGCDSLTAVGGFTIAEICSKSIVHRDKDGNDQDAVDPVMSTLPDFGHGVHRSMEMKDWQRYMQKLADVDFGLRRAATRKGLHLVVTALEEERDIYEGEGRARRFKRRAQGPLLYGQASAAAIPPFYQLFLRLEAKVLKADREAKGDMAPTSFAAWTQSRGGWPAGGRGDAFAKLQPCERNPSLFEMFQRCGLA